MRFLRTTQNPLTRNVASLVGATAIAQAVQLGVTPFLTRIYGPEEFAVFQVYFSLAAILSVIATLRYELAVVASDDSQEAKKLVAGSLGISLGVGLLVFTTLASFKIYGRIEVPSLYLWTLPLFVILSGTSQAFNNYSIRNSTFQLNFWSRILSSIAQAGVALGMGLQGALHTGLMTSVVAGQVVWALILGKGFPMRTEFPSTRSRVNQVMVSLKRHSKFPKYNAPHALIDVVQDHGIIFLLGFFFENTIMAFYGQAYRLLKAPVGFIGSAIHQVYYPDFTRRIQSGENLRPALLKMYLRLFIIGLPFFATIAWFAEPLFTWLLGPQWTEVGRIARLLTPWLFLNFIVSPFDSIPLILSRQGTAALIATFEFILRAIAIIIGSVMESAMTGLALVGIFSALISCTEMVWYYRITGKNHK